jgi:uncharacterized protein (TIGR03435 family)
MPVLSRPLSGVTLTAALLAVLASPSLLAQVTGGPAPTAPPAAATPAPMEFDVVSVKPNTSESGMMRVMTRPGIFSATGVTLKTLIQQAYNIREDLISSGPGWVGSSAWDIEGKISPADADALKAMTNEQRNAAQRQMMQHALVDRFKLQTHIETKTLPVYELVLAKGGSRLKEADPNSTYANGIKGPDGVGKAGMMRFGRDRLDAQGVPINSLVSFLSQRLERTVIDKTGLTGKYDVTLTFIPEDDTPGKDNGASDSNTPDLFTAVQEQLGLKLVSSKGPVDTLVIDNAEKPAEN